MQMLVSLLCIPVNTPVAASIKCLIQVLPLPTMNNEKERLIKQTKMYSAQNVITRIAGQGTVPPSPAKRSHFSHLMLNTDI